VRHANSNRKRLEKQNRIDRSASFNTQESVDALIVTICKFLSQWKQLGSQLASEAQETGDLETFRKSLKIFFSGGSYFPVRDRMIAKMTVGKIDNQTLCFFEISHLHCFLHFSGTCNSADAVFFPDRFLLTMSSENGKGHSFTNLTFGLANYGKCLRSFLFQHFNSRLIRVTRTSSPIDLESILRQIQDLPNQLQRLKGRRYLPSNTLRRFFSTLLVFFLATGRISSSQFAASCVLMAHTAQTDVKEYSYVSNGNSLYPRTLQLLESAAKKFEFYTYKQGNNIFVRKDGTEKELLREAHSVLQILWRFVESTANSGSICAASSSTVITVDSDDDEMY